MSKKKSSSRSVLIVAFLLVLGAKLAYSFGNFISDICELVVVVISRALYTFLV